MIIQLPGKPIPLKRPRGTKSGIFYDPQYKVKENIRSYVKTHFKDEIKLLSEPFVLKLEFHYPMPKSWSKKKKNEKREKPHDGNYDLDNFIKMIGDTFNGMLWEDDRLIYRIEAIKIWDDIGFTKITYS